MLGEALPVAAVFLVGYQRTSSIPPLSSPPHRWFSVWRWASPTVPSGPTSVRWRQRVSGGLWACCLISSSQSTCLSFMELALRWVRCFVKDFGFVEGEGFVEGCQMLPNGYWPTAIRPKTPGSPSYSSGAHALQQSLPQQRLCSLRWSKRKCFWLSCFAHVNTTCSTNLLTLVLWIKRYWLVCVIH